MVEGTEHPPPAFVQHVGVNLGGGHIRMAQEFLDGSNIVAGLQKVRREGPSSFRVETNGDNRWWS